MSSANSISFLRQAPDKNFLEITNLVNNEKINGGRIHLGDIPGEDLDGYIKNSLGPITADVDFYVVHRKMVGTTHRKDERTPSYRIIVKAPVAVPTAPVHQAQPVEHARQPHTMDHQPMPIPSYSMPPISGLSNPYPANHFGLGLPDIIKMNVDSHRLKDHETLVAELKEELKDAKAEIRALSAELRTEQAKTAIAESKTDLAVMMAKAEQKSFFDGDGFQKIMDVVPQIVQARMGGGASPQAAGLGAPNVSETVQQVIDYIAANCTDHQAALVGSIFHFIDNPQFVADYTALLNKYKDGTQDNNG